LLHESENGFNGGYHFVRKNCEDFAAQCYEVEFPTARDLNIMRSEKACKRRRGSAAGGGADELCGILLNCPSNRSTSWERIVLSHSDLTRRSEGVHRHGTMGRNSSSRFG
jgi:hypothetical protein